MLRRARYVRSSPIEWSEPIDIQKLDSSTHWGRIVPKLTTYNFKYAILSFDSHDRNMTIVNFEEPGSEPLDVDSAKEIRDFLNHYMETTGCKYCSIKFITDDSEWHITDSLLRKF